MFSKSLLIKKFSRAFMLMLGFGCFFLAANPEAEAISRAQYQVGSNAGATSISLTLGSSPADGNALIMVIGTRGTATGNVSSITQTGATWNKASEIANSNGITSEIWYALNVSSAGTGITVNLASSLKASCIVAEYSGIATSSALDVSSAGTTGSSTAPSTALTVTTNQADELWVGGMANINTYTYSGQTNGFTEVAESASTSGAGSTRNNTVFEEKIVSATAQANTSATLSTTNQWAGIISTFKAQITTISGNAYSDEAGTPTVWSQCGATSNIGLSVDGGTKVNTTCNGSTGAYSFSVPTFSAADQVIAVFLDPASAGDKGVLYTKNSSLTGPISGLKITKNRIRIESESSQSITNADINTYDYGSDNDIPADSNGTDLSTQGSGIELHVNSSDTYAAGGTITVSNLHIKGAYSGASETLIITGSGTGDCSQEPGTIRPLCTDGGTFTPASNTTRYTGTSSLNVENDTYNILEFKPASNSPTYTLGTGGSQTITCNSNLVVGDGANAVTVSTTTNSPNVTVAGNITTNSSATLTGSGTGTITVNGGAATGAGGAITLTGGTFLLYGTGNFSNSNSWTFNNLTFGNGSATNTTTAVGTASVTVAGVLTIAASHTLDAGSNKQWILSGSGTPFIKTGNLTGSSSTFRYTSTSNTNIAAADYYNLQLQPSGAGTPTYTLATAASSTISASVLTIGDGTYGVTASTTTYSPTINVSSMIVDSGSTLSGSGTSTITAQAYIQGAGTINLSNGTVEQRVNAAYNIGPTGSNNWIFNDLIFSNSSGTGDASITPYASGTGNITVNGTLQVGRGTDAYRTTFNNETNDRDLVINGNVNITSKGSLSASSTKSFTVGGNFTNSGTFTANSGTLTFNDAGKVSTLLNSGTSSFYGLAISTPTKEVDFDNVNQIDVTGSFTVNGSACGTMVKLRSDSGSPFELNVTGSSSVQYADIMNSTAVSGLSASTSIDSGGNSGWSISEGACATKPIVGIEGGVDLSGGVTITTQ